MIGSHISSKHPLHEIVYKPVPGRVSNKHVAAAGFANTDSRYVCMYINVCVCDCMSACTYCPCACRYIYFCVYDCMSLCACCLCVFVSVCMIVCLCVHAVYVYVCVSVSVCMIVCPRVHAVYVYVQVHDTLATSILLLRTLQTRF